MFKYIYITILALAVASCGGDGVSQAKAGIYKGTATPKERENIDASALITSNGNVVLL